MKKQLNEYNDLSKQISQILSKHKIRPISVKDNNMGHSVVWFSDEKDLNRAETLFKRKGFKLYDKDTGFRNNRITVKEVIKKVKTKNINSMYKKLTTEMYGLNKNKVKIRESIYAGGNKFILAAYSKAKTKKDVIRIVKGTSANPPLDMSKTGNGPQGTPEEIRKYFHLNNIFVTNHSRKWWVQLSYTNGKWSAK